MLLVRDIVAAVGIEVNQEFLRGEGTGSNHVLRGHRVIGAGIVGHILDLPAVEGVAFGNRHIGQRRGVAHMQAFLRGRCAEAARHIAGDDIAQRVVDRDKRRIIGLRLIAHGLAIGDIPAWERIAVRRGVGRRHDGIAVLKRLGLVFLAVNVEGDGVGLLLPLRGVGSILGDGGGNLFDLAGVIVLPALEVVAFSADGGRFQLVAVVADHFVAAFLDLAVVFIEVDGEGLELEVSVQDVLCALDCRDGQRIVRVVGIGLIGRRIIQALIADHNVCIGGAVRDLDRFAVDHGAGLLRRIKIGAGLCGIL